MWGGWVFSRVLLSDHKRVGSACSKPCALRAIGAGGDVHFIRAGFQGRTGDSAVRVAVLVLDPKPFRQGMGSTDVDAVHGAGSVEYLKLRGVGRAHGGYGQGLWQ